MILGGVPKCEARVRKQNDREEGQPTDVPLQAYDKADCSKEDAQVLRGPLEAGAVLSLCPLCPVLRAHSRGGKVCAFWAVSLPELCRHLKFLESSR